MRVRDEVTGAAKRGQDSSIDRALRQLGFARGCSA
jgi:hypothetical protein